MHFYKIIATVIFLSFLSVIRAQQTDSLPLSVDLQDVVVTAQYAPTDTKKALYKVRVLKSEKWEAQGQNTLMEVLQQQLNMRIVQDPILGSGLSIQGLSGEHVLIMIDGVPITGRVGGDIDLSQLNMTQFKRVEIIAGSMSAQYGSNAAGGVINLVSKKHQIKPWKIEAGSQFESIKIDNQHFRIGKKIGLFQIDGGINRYKASFASEDSIRAVKTVVDQDGNSRKERLIPWHPKEQLSYDANISFTPNDSLFIRYGYRSLSARLSLLGDIRRRIYRPYAIDQFFTTNRSSHHLALNYWISNKLYWQTTAGLNAFQRDKETIRWDVEPDTTSIDPNGLDTTNYSAALVRSSLNFISKGKCDAQLGLEYLNESGKGRRILDASTNDLQPNILNMAIWASFRYKPSDSFAIEGNLRKAYNNRYRHPFVPSLQLRWNIRKNLQWRVGYARGFRSPSVQELFFNFIDANHYIIGNTELSAENAHNFRLNGSWSYDHNQSGLLTVDMTLFHNKIFNRITIVQSPTDDAPNRYSYGNVDHYETHGLNIETAFNPTTWINIKCTGGYTRLLNTLDVPSNKKERFIGLFELSNTLGISIRKTSSHIHLSHRYVGKQDIYQLDNDNEIKQGLIGDYHLVNLGLSQHFWSERIRLGIGAKNIFGTERVPIVGTVSSGGAHAGSSNNRLIGFGRSFYINLSLSINK